MQRALTMRRLLLGVVLASAASCGGGSDQPSSAIDGVWKGDLYQGVILCSDGTSIGAGAGTVVEAVELHVTGTDEVGSTVLATDGDCELQGTRTADGFRATPTSGCAQGLDNLVFSIISENEAGLSYHYDINEVPAGSNGVRCVITPSGTVMR